MIRRDAFQPDGSRTWVLISQVEHARLSGDLAHHWGAGGTSAPEPRDEVIAAIYRHDDGWAEWEQTPDVDPEHGRPLAFTEMPLADGLAIWRTSIEGVAALGSLAPWMVAGHFSALLRGSSSANDPIARSWLDEFSRRQDGWLAAWQAEDRRRHTPDVAARALAQLQMFDALSLWLCCAERSEPYTFATPAGPDVTFAPDSPTRIILSPFPLSTDPLDVEVHGQAIPAKHYANQSELAAADHQPVTLRWQLSSKIPEGRSSC